MQLTCGIQALWLEERIYAHAFQLPQVAFLQVQHSSSGLHVPLTKHSSAQRACHLGDHTSSLGYTPKSSCCANCSVVADNGHVHALAAAPGGRVLGGAPLTWVGLT